MIKAIFFDVDDTLYDHTYHLSQGIAAIRSEYKFLQNYSQESLEDLSQRLLEEVHLELMAGNMTYEESRALRWRRFLIECGDTAGEYNAPEAAAIYARAYYESERATPGSIELLQTLKTKYALGVISNNLLEEQLKKMHRIGVGKYFDSFAISEEVGYAKPDPRIFEIALERAGVKSEEAVLIGDSWTNDIIGAKNAGILPIWFNRKGKESPDPSIAEIRSFDTSSDLLSQLRNSS